MVNTKHMTGLMLDISADYYVLLCGMINYN